MKTLYIHATLKFNKELLKKIKIKEKYEVVTTIQYLKEIKKYFKNAKQILGCSVFPKKQTYLYIGTGKFHPLRLAKFAKNIYILNPETKQFYKSESKEIELYNKQLKQKQKIFLMSKNRGILVSTKNGQYHLNTAKKLAKKLKAKIFLFNTLQEYELENFPQITCWINTACQRIEGKNIINAEDLPKV